MISVLSETANNFWRKVTGDPKSFSLESRIFHSFSFIAFATLCFGIPFTLLIRLPVSTLIACLVFVIQLILYYLSRVKQKPKIAVTLSLIEINILTAVNYIFEGGIAGPNLFMFAMYLFIMICVADRKYWPFYLLMNLAIVLGLIAWEYYHPQAFGMVYQSRRDRFLDNGVAYIILAILLYSGASQILKNYNRQRELSEEKARDYQQLDQEKSKLLSILSHDLRAPLASIQQYFSMLAEMELGANEKRALENHLLKTIGNTQELVTNVLSWAKKQAGGHKVNLHEINLYQEINSTAEFFRTIAFRKGISLDIDIEPSIVVTADTDMLQLILRNLLNNAIKFSNSDTTVELKAMAHNGLCMISVKDDGIGIPINKQKDIFSLQVKSTYGTANEKGSGLGLALCKEFVELQGGDISFTSILGKGSVFYITLPCAPEEKKIISPAPSVS